MEYPSKTFQSLLDRLYREARQDWYRYPLVGIKMLWTKITGRETALSRYRLFRDCYIPVSRSQGEYLYQTVRSTNARRIVEFGTSFGLSTLFLAAACRDNGGGRVITTELLENKVDRARGYIRAAGLSDFVEFRTGDALETLRDVEGPLDLVFLDGWEPQYLPLLRMLSDRIRPGGIVLADDVRLYWRLLRPYQDWVRDPEHGFTSLTLGPPFRDGLEVSVKL